MVVAVHVELHVRRPSVSHHLQGDDVVARVKRVFSVNKEESPFPLVVPFSKEGENIVDSALNSSLEAGIELRITARVFCLGAGYFQKGFCK